MEKLMDDTIRTRLPRSLKKRLAKIARLRSSDCSKVTTGEVIRVALAEYVEREEGK
jgi:predicted transcriptional regulator